MSRPCRMTSSFGAVVAAVAAATLWTMALSAPSLALGAHHRHLHRMAYIVCDTPDVHSCHKDFARRHGVQAH